MSEVSKQSSISHFLAVVQKVSRISCSNGHNHKSLFCFPCFNPPLSLGYVIYTYRLHIIFSSIGHMELANPFASHLPTFPLFRSEE